VVCFCSPLGLGTELVKSTGMARVFVFCNEACLLQYFADINTHYYTDLAHITLLTMALWNVVTGSESKMRL